MHMEYDLPGSIPAFPVAGIGAAAGGHAAVTALLRAMPAEPGMALLVLVEAPGAATAEMLQQASAMPVLPVTRSMPILPNRVYLIAPAASLALHGDKLVMGQATPLTIDGFLEALAQAQAGRAIGIVLSGAGAQGAAGLAAIREMGGVTLAQLPADAAHEGMPRAAIDAGLADFVLAAAAMPARLVQLRDHRNAIHAYDDTGAARGAITPGTLLDEMLATLRRHTGHDFLHYRRAPLVRRLERRLQVRAVAGLPAYLQLLQDDAGEAHALMDDLLIGVTGFFRDRPAFDALARKVLPALFDARHDGTPLRAWVAACSTGEEAYSLAMLLAEQQAQAPVQRPLQVFASDVDEGAIRVARAGQYAQASVAQVPPPLLERYFLRDSEKHMVRKTLRDQLVFTRHNLLHDPVFSRLDLISCRNVLIYLNRDMHRLVLAQFHFALKPGGYLFLGGAESVEAAEDLFAPIDAAQRIFQARPAPRALVHVPAAWDERTVRKPHRPPAQVQDAQRGRLFSFADIHHHKSAELGPPSILLDAHADILHVSESAARFLHPSGGEPTRALAALVAPPLQPALRAALLEARRSGQRASTGVVRFQHADRVCSVDLQVQPFHDQHAEGELLLVQFFHIQDGPPAPGITLAAGDAGVLRELDEELRQVRRQLHDTMAQAELSGSAMLVHIEELQTTVEQLRATVAELELANNQLQMQQEVLALDNGTLRQRAGEADKAHDDLGNLVASSGVATIFLDRAMRIQRYTPRIADFFNVLPSDIGRPLLHITNRLDYPALAAEAARVFDTLQAMEREVRATDGRDYIVRVHPYRTTQDRIEGAVMTFFDISNWRATEKALHDSEERLRLFVSAVSDTLYKMSPDWNVMHSLQGKTFLADTDNPNPNWLASYIPESEQPRVHAAIAQAIAGKTVFELEHRVIRGDGTVSWTFSRAIPLLDADGNIVEWFGAATDITARKHMAQAGSGRA